MTKHICLILCLLLAGMSLAAQNSEVRVYKGCYALSSNQVLKIEDRVSLAEFAAIWYACTYLIP